MESNKSLISKYYQLLLFSVLSYMVIISTVEHYNDIRDVMYDICLWTVLGVGLIFTAIILVKDIKNDNKIWRWTSYQMVVLIFFVLSLVVPEKQYNVLDIVLMFASLVTVFIMLLLPAIALKKNMNLTVAVPEFNIYASATVALFILSFTYGG